MATVDVRRADERFHSELDWLDSWHSFSFSNHYDPKNTHHGLLLVHNDDVVAPGTGFGTAPAPRHGDRHVGARRCARAPRQRGQPRRDPARPRAAHERGPRHPPLRAEREPDRAGAPPADVGDPRRRAASRPSTRRSTSADGCTDDALFPLASGREDDAAITIHQRDATLWVGRLDRRRDVGGARRAVRARVRRAGQRRRRRRRRLDTGDAVRLTDAGAHTLTAGPDGAEVTVWETY